LLAPTPASAFTCAGDVGTGPAPISHLAINDFIICVNTEARTNNAGSAIDLRTTGSGSFIDLTSSGALISTASAAKRACGSAGRAAVQFFGGRPTMSKSAS
jgi:hypothetical protein